MMYLVLDIQSTEHTDKLQQLHAWVNVVQQSDALNILGEELSLLGWSITDIIESTTTEKSDYFPPCKSLDAFNEAAKGLFALRFKQP